MDRIEAMKVFVAPWMKAALPGRDVALDARRPP